MDSTLEKGVPCWQFDTLSNELLEGLWGFVDLMPDYVQTYLEDAVSKRGRNVNVTQHQEDVPPEMVDVVRKGLGYVEEDIMGKLKGWGFQ